MAISKELMLQMAQKLRAQRLNSDFYDEIDSLMQEALQNISKKNGLSINQFNYFIAGDHMLNTNILNASPLVIFVSIKQTREQIILLRKSKRTHKRLQKFITPNIEVTDEFLAMQLFKKLQAQLSNTDKLFITKNILMLNVAQMVKIKIIVGYLLQETFEYEYLGNYYEENTLKIIEALDKKEKETSCYYDIVRILKSIEIEVYDLGYTKSKIFDSLYFIENLIYNVPNELLCGNNLYEVFLKTINYLKNAPLNEFKLPTSENTMFSANTQYSLQKAKYFIKVVENFFKHFDKIFI